MTPGRYACRTKASVSRSSTAVSEPSSCSRHNSIRSAASEKTAKLVPAPSYVAPSGYACPGQTCIDRTLPLLIRVLGGFRPDTPRKTVLYLVRRAVRPGSVVSSRRAGQPGTPRCRPDRGPGPPGVSSVRPVACEGVRNHYEPSHSTRSHRKEQTLDIGELSKEPVHPAAPAPATGVPFLDRWWGSGRRYTGELGRVRAAPR